MKLNLKYLPKKLTKKDRIKQTKMIIKSKKMYTKDKYYNRGKVKSYKSKTSKHILKAKNIYKVNKIGVTKQLSKASGCSKDTLSKIIKKGEGAYYSSGSRPNQTAQSWGIARLASALTSGKAAAVDFNIIKEGCKNKSKAMRLAKIAVTKYGYGTRKVPIVVIDTN